MSYEIPTCGECGRTFIPRSPKRPFWVQHGDNPPVLFRGQSAALARFLCSPVGREHPWDSLYQALGGSSEVTRCLRRIRLGGIPYVCRMVAKRSGRGEIGLYSFPPNMKGWEPNDGEADDAA